MGSDGKRWTWRESGKPLKPHQVNKTVKFGGGSLMMWGCILSKGVGRFCRIDGTMNASVYKSILEDKMFGTIKDQKLSKSSFIFQHDNDPKHTSKLVKEFLQNEGIKVLSWPAQSPDLNPIENCWNYLKRKLGSYETSPSGVLELWERIEVEWEKIPVNFCKELVDSMPKRIAAVIAAKGGNTKY